MVEVISISALSAALKYIEILKILPAETNTIKLLLRTDQGSVEAVVTELDNFGIVSWHKKDGIVHKTRRTKKLLDFIETMKSDIKPDFLKIISRQANAKMKKG